MEYAEKRKRLESITKEVVEFHPLLEQVLPRMPNVKSYEYTHGQFERGADFVLEIEDGTTHRRSHVGVVAKCGKVGGAKNVDVEDQVKECSEERHYQVMNRVRCSQVWVISTEGYTERTKEKLLARLVGRTIEFFGTEDLIRLIDEFHPYFWDNLPGELGTYFRDLKARLEITDKSTSVLINSNGQGSYIELDTYERIVKNYTNRGKVRPEFRNVDFLKEAIQTKVSVLEADMGFGKSKLARRLAFSLTNSASFLKTKIVPIFSSFRLFLDNYNGEVDLLIKGHLGNAISCLEDPRVKVLIILDGIDECSNTHNTSTELFERLQKSIKDSYQYSAVVTTRPLKSLVDKAALYDGTRTFGVRPLSLAKIVRFLQETCGGSNLPSRLFEDLKKSPLFKQLPHSPIAAALFSNLLAQNRQEVPQNLTELYSKSMEHMLGRWDLSKELATEKQFKTAQTIAEQLAAYYVDNRLIYVSIAEVNAMVEDYLKRRNIGISAEVIANLLFSRSNVFITDAENSTIAFRHRSFAEYLCAQRKAKDRSLSVSSSALDPYWTNVFYFYVGTLLDCPEVLQDIRRANSNSEVEEWMKLLAVPSYLLAAYQTEFDEVEANIKAVLFDTARLYLKVKEGSTATRLSELSEMHVLYLFKTLVIESMAYEFFERCFETVCISISDELEDETVKSFAQFFLACAALECGNENIFKYIIKNIGTAKLPITLSLAVRCELEANGRADKSGLLKFHLDKLHKFLRPTGKGKAAEQLSVHSMIDDLFKKPISSKKSLKSAL